MSEPRTCQHLAVSGEAVIGNFGGDPDKHGLPWEALPDDPDPVDWEADILVGTRVDVQLERCCDCGAWLATVRVWGQENRGEPTWSTTRTRLARRIDP